MRSDISFKTSDGTTLRGWHYTPAKTPAPVVVMAHGFSALKEHNLGDFASAFASAGFVVVVFDHRNFGESDTDGTGIQYEIVPALQMSDYSDVITFATSLKDVDPTKVAIWGSSLSGGLVLQVAAQDRRVKAVISQVPLASGGEISRRFSPPNKQVLFTSIYAKDRLNRQNGKKPIYISIISKDGSSGALPTPDAWRYFGENEKAPRWKNTITLKSMENLRAFEPGLYIGHISPTPLLMVVADGDMVTPADLALDAYARAKEPKQLHIIPGGHFDGYQGQHFAENLRVQIDFLTKQFFTKAKL